MGRNKYRGAAEAADKEADKLPNKVAKRKWSWAITLGFIAVGCAVGWVLGYFSSQYF